MWADFPFAAVGEQFGLAGCAVIMGLIAICLVRIWRIATLSRDLLGTYLCAGVFTMLNVLQYAGVNATGQIIFLLVACAVALSAGRSLGLATGWPIPHIPVSEGSGTRRRDKPARSRSRRSKDSVVEGPWQRGPAPQPPRGSRRYRLAPRIRLTWSPRVSQSMGFEIKPAAPFSRA